MEFLFNNAMFVLETMDNKMEATYHVTVCVCVMLRRTKKRILFLNTNILLNANRNYILLNHKNIFGRGPFAKMKRNTKNEGFYARVDQNVDP